MSSYSEAFHWLFTASNWSGSTGIGARIAEHLEYSAYTILIAVVIALPLGLLIGHTGFGRAVIIPFTGALRALPTLGLLTVLALQFGIGLKAPLIALVILALPPILAGAYAGVESVDRTTVDASRATGFTEWQVLSRVELPLGSPIILGGIRSASLQVIATWTVAAFLPVGGLGRYLIDGLAIRDYAQMLGGSIVVIVLALLVDGLFAVVTRFATPTGVRALSSAVRSAAE
ncbi:ABC transporter permease subunit [Gordonia jinhuaensis]|uniref:Osmoprotectant (Glycine betaine/ carnitine/choline/l-proline) ABC transporter ProZ n=1 Tax=Gordonia jinhuaensis TaxID=1517702 RepID=A0A916WWX2_9ACTN|nr:ABC transporter permease [Gordonia jinhuaensis]GGB38865.1 putative osmoprotectant (glycine betaine/ carnitine/choline/l-proline) ABC transporter ProZ [Gordonia jinhuaensis]